MDIAITRGAASDRIEIVRGDGSSASFALPHKGPLPHDAVHYFVERALGLGDGFWGMVAAGRDPQAIGAMARDAGHASAKRARVPDPEVVPIIQVERLVEAFEADLWSGGGDNGSLRAMADAGCAQSHVPPLALDDRVVDRIRADIAAFASEWSARATGETVTLEWPEPAA